MGNAPDVPKPENPSITASKQQNLNTLAGTQSQQGSMVNQTNPFGSLTYSQTGTSPDGTPLYTAKTSLDSSQQQLLDILNGTKTAAGTAGKSLISGANYGAQQPGDVIGNSTSGLVKDAMAKQIAYLQPGFDYDVDRLNTKLKNQGFAQGDVGYDKAMNALKQSQGQTVTGFESTMEPQMYQQSLQNYLLPAQLGGTLAGIGSPTQPTFGQTPGLSIQPANLIGATANANQANMEAYKAENDKNSSMMSGLFGIPTSLLGGWAQSGGLQGLMGSAALAAV